MYIEGKIIGYLDDLASGKHTPGGGSSVPLLGAVCASIACFVVNLSKNKKKYLSFGDRLAAIHDRAETLKRDFVLMIDKDSEVLSRILDAYKRSDMPESERDETLKEAVAFSVGMCEMCVETLEMGLELANMGNRMLSSDVEIIAFTGEAALNGSIANIKINAGAVRDDCYRDSIRTKCESFRREGERLKREIIAKTELTV
jgi:formiminotetrahydrofolate cyclodeaminase